jgi:hypothetical protein
MPRQLRSILRSTGASVALALVVAACSSPTTETGVVQSPGSASGPMTKIAVFAGRVQADDRRTLEDTYVDALSRYEVRAVPSYSLFVAGQVPEDPAVVRAFLQQRGYDGALVSARIGFSAPVLVTPGMDWAGGFLDSYAGSRSPDDTESEPQVTFETTLWNPTNGKMVWSAFTPTENPLSGRDFAPSLASKVVSSLARQGLIPAVQGAPVSLAR